MKKFIETYSTLAIFILIYFVMLFYPAWTGIDHPGNAPAQVYGYTIFAIGWLGILMLYVPWYFFFPAISIINKIVAGREGKMRLSRTLLFLFWLEGFIGVVGFKYGGSGDSGDFIITATGPSFWMWTILVWYILLYSHFYVRTVKDPRIFKYLSIMALVGSVLVVGNYHLQNYKVSTFQNPLNAAIANNDLSAIENLIQKGTGLNESMYPSIPTAAQLGSDASTVRFLIQKGANVNARDYAGESAIEIASGSDRAFSYAGYNASKIQRSKDQELEITKILILAGADNESKSKALVNASGMCNLEMAKLLIDSGANIDFGVIDSGATVTLGNSGDSLFHATDGACLDVVKFLIGKGANVNAKNDWRGSILEEAETREFDSRMAKEAEGIDRHYRYQEIVKVLKNAGAVR